MFAYDAENHTIQAPAGCAAYGPTGQPYQLMNNYPCSSAGNQYPHFDGGQLLFVTDASGALVVFKLESLADWTPSNGSLAVLDRDMSGVLKSAHNAIAYSGVNFGTVIWPSYKGAPSQSSTPTYNGSSNEYSCSPSCPMKGLYPYTRLEGFDWAGLTIQGVRTTDRSTGQWTTPDAYAGDVHDPMSQKPFMWDRNNPYEYGDPTGFYPGQVGDASNHPYSWASDSGGAPAEREQTRRRKFGKKKPIDDAIFEGDHPVLGEEGYVTNATAKEILDWGRGQPSWQSLNQKIKALNTQAVAEMRDKGLPEWKVRELYNQLARAYNADKEYGNLTLMPRLEYLQRILKLWPGRKK